MDRGRTDVDQVAAEEDEPIVEAAKGTTKKVEILSVKQNENGYARSLSERGGRDRLYAGLR